MSKRRIGVVGAGNMGSGIAQKTATEGFEVVLVDVDEEAAKRGKEKIVTLLAEGVERRIFPQETATAIAGRIHPSGRLEDLADVELVIEAVFEDLDVKRELFAKLDTICHDGTILATNTSSFTVDDVASATGRADRVVGLHYFYHPAKNRLVEVVPGSATSTETRERAWTFSEATGKTPIHSADSPGFVVNRYFVPWINEAVRLLDEGVADIPTIEEGAKKAFRIGMGPFELMNVTGVPIAMMDATWITAQRTAAATAVAARRLARPGATSFGILGCGVQGRSNVEALKVIFPIKTVIAYDVDEEDQDPGDGITTHEFRCTVHGAKERGFILQLFTARACFIFIYEAG